MVRYNPLIDGMTADLEDQELVARAQDGNREALEVLIKRHQSWIYNLVLRMIYHPDDAQDATQEILFKLVTKLSSFEGRSSFRTWLYRIAANHVLNMKRGRLESATMSFEDFGRGLDNTPDMDLPDQLSVPVDVQLLVDEARISCTSAMLLCLNREQRLVYILGEIFGVTDSIGAELLEISRENFRQRLGRARRDLHNFMQEKCGLINRANPCRCARKTQGFIKAGYVDPHKLLFARERMSRVREVAEKTYDDILSLDAQYAEIHRNHPFQDGPDFIATLRDLIDGSDFKSTFELN
jgi:RNA polymerase sigma factor (sigma-70 family)